jgi:prophage antirepressor-like protein
MNELKIFENPEFGAIRTVVIDNEPWFVGNDVAKALGYKDTYSALRHNVDDEDKRLCPVGSTSGTQDTLVISESGLYSLIFGSKLEKAKEFKHWVTAEILPSIRKNGGYIQNQEQMTPEQIVANALIVANKIIAEKEAKIVEMRPKAEYFDNLVDSKLLTTFRDTAKELHIPPQQLIRWLIDNKYVYRDRHNMLKPYESHRKSGLFQMKDFSTPFGYSNVQTYVTVKGKETFRLLIGGAK